MSNPQNQFVALGLAMALSACASSSQGTEEPAPPVVGQTTVTVQNNYAADMAIYVVNPVGGRWRIGTVMSSSRAKLVVPPHMLTEPGLQLLTQTIGPGAAFIFPRMAISPPARLELLLEPNLVYSTIWLR
jgi:hypothetical protein